MSKKLRKLKAKIRPLKATVKNKKLVLEVPLELLKCAIPYGRHGLEITNLANMGKWYASNILQFVSPNDGVGGDPMFQNLLDLMAEDAYQSGEEWITETWQRFVVLENKR